jgi:iron complex transport system substrate-binding protein
MSLPASAGSSSLFIFSEKKDIKLKINSSHAIASYYLLIVILTAAIISGCSDKKSSGATQESDKIAFEDMTGRSVMIPQSKDIKRVAVLTSPQVLAAYVVGVQDKLCGVASAVKEWDLLSMFDPHLKKVPDVHARMGQVNIEALLQTDPDIVIGSGTDIAAVETSTRLATLRINETQAQGSISQIRDEIRIFGKVFGKEEKAEQYVSYLDNILSLIKFSLADIPADKRLKVFMGFDAGHLSTYGSGTFMDEWIRAAGCVNAAGAVSGLGGKEGGLVTVSMEQVLSWDPDIVIIDNGSPDDLLSDPLWSRLKALQNKKVYRLPVGLFIWNRASCEAAVMLPQWLAITAYPDKLSFMDINDRVKEFYARNFAFQLTDNIVHNMLYPSAETK